MFQAFWHASSADHENAIPVQCDVKIDGLTWQAPEGEVHWAFDDLIFEAAPEIVSPMNTQINAKTQGFKIKHRHRGDGFLYTWHYPLLNALLPHLIGEQRQQGLALYNAYRPTHGNRVLLGVLAGMALMAGLLWLFFWGQIQLRKQQLALADQELPQLLGQKHEQSFAQHNNLCEGERWQTLTQQLLQDYQRQSQTDNLRALDVFPSPQAEALMLSNGHLLLSTALIKDFSWPTLIAFLAHEEGHLMLHHRLESRIYDQGNQIFKRLWQPVDDKAYLLSAPLWVQYSRGQEAAADHWAFTHLPQENTLFDFKALAKKALVYLDDPIQKKGFVARHPWATDRLQGIDQRLSPSTTPTNQKNISLESLRKETNRCEQKRKGGML